MEYLRLFVDFLLPYGVHSYFLMFIVLLACGAGLPMPEDIVLITGGILSARGVCTLTWTTIVCFAGVLIGDGTIFIIGRVFGARVKSSWLYRRVLNERLDAKIQHSFAKYGDKIIFMARFMPGLRMPIFLTSGIYRVSPWKFFLLDGFAAVVSVPVWIYVGYVFGENFELLEQKMRQFKFGLYAALGAIILLFIGAYFLKRRINQSLTS